MISIPEPVEDTPTGRMMVGIIEVMDEFYSANLGQEVTRGMREAVSRGFCVGSSTPYGYRRVKVQDGEKGAVNAGTRPQHVLIGEKEMPDGGIGYGVKRNRQEPKCRRHPFCEGQGMVKGNHS